MRGRSSYRLLRNFIAITYLIAGKNDLKLPLETADCPGCLAASPMDFMKVHKIVRIDPSSCIRGFCARKRFVC